MTILVLDGDLVGDALAELGDDELMIVVDPSADTAGGAGGALPRPARDLADRRRRRDSDPGRLGGQGARRRRPSRSFAASCGGEARRRPRNGALGPGGGGAARAERRRGRPRRSRPRQRRRPLAARRRRRARQEPRRAARQPARRRGSDPDLERGRARLPAAAEPDPRRHGDERKDDDHGVARCDVPRGRPRRRRRRQRRPCAERGGGAGRDVDRLRALELPARGHPRLPSSRRSAGQPRAGSPRPARLVRGLPRREAAHLREPAGRETRRCVPRGFGRVPGSAARVEFDADDPLPAEPGLPGRHNRENAAAATAAARAAGIPDEAIAEALQTFPGVASPARARRRDRRRALRQRLEGDEHRRGPARARLRTTSLCT